MRYVIVLGALTALVYFLTRSRRAQRVLQIILGVLALYAVLKMTGVIEAIAPDRSGVF